MVELFIPAAPEACFAAFCDLSLARLWVPGLKQVKVVRSDEQGRALEATYEYGEALSYALVYAYDEAGKKVRWVPSAGVLDGVSGSATFFPHEGGCRFVYSLDSRRGRSPHHPEDVARAFAEWMRAGARK
ncbi:MAG: SRPBCC family protein [Myxococcota bacterium]